MCVYIYAYANAKLKIIDIPQMEYEIIHLCVICEALLESLPLSICFSQFAISGLGLIEFNHMVIVFVFCFWNR